MGKSTIIIRQQTADSRQQTADSRQQTADSRRNVYLDAVKGLAIFLVVFGHCIQYHNGKSFDFFGDPVFRIIYSFHMPLFALVSGYLFYRSTQRMTPRELVVKQSVSLLIPVMSWILLESIVRLIQGENPGFLQALKLIAINFFFKFWFLWSMFWCSLAVIIARKFFHDRAAFYILVIVLLLFIPRTSLHSFVYPYFVVGYIWNRESLDTKIHTLPSRLKISAGIAVIALWLIMLPFYGYDSFVYTTGVSLVKYKERIFAPSQFWIDVFRWAIGFAGSLSVMIVMKLIKPVKILTLPGSKTLGIYIVSGYLLAYIRLGHGGYVMNFIEAVITTSLCCALTVLIGRNIILRKLFLGGR